MACFIVPTVEAIAVSIINHNIKKREQNTNNVVLSHSDSCTDNTTNDNQNSKISFSTKLGWLNKLLWGGSLLLLVEHIWHGEIVPYFPFFTAMQSKADTILMLQEMATVGVAMALACTLVWCGMLAISSIKESPASLKKNKNKIKD